VKPPAATRSSDTHSVLTCCMEHIRNTAVRPREQPRILPCSHVVICDVTRPVHHTRASSIGQLLADVYMSQQPWVLDTQQLPPLPCPAPHLHPA
jgi:hypothetical protein